MMRKPSSTIALIIVTLFLNVNLITISSAFRMTTTKTTRIITSPTSGIVTKKRKDSCNKISTATTTTKLFSSSSPSSMNNNEDLNNNCWNPSLRKVMTGVASLGSLETAYLTYEKLTSNNEGLASSLCNTISNGSGSCTDVLNSPYATLSLPNNIDVPLSAIGCIVYTMTAITAAYPLLSSKNDVDDTWNRIALLVLSTGLGTFSIFLLSLLWNVLHQSCFFCYTSATLAFTLCACSYFGGLIPDNNSSSSTPKTKEKKVALSTILDDDDEESSMNTISTPRRTALQASAFSVVASIMASVVIFANTDGGVAVAKTEAAAQPPTTPGVPPPITTTSSAEAIQVAKQLKSLDATMYGAFWCSLCYDQKQTFGKEAFYSNIKYVECSKDGVNEQSKVCKDNKIPGYPTWIIAGKQYPGEQDLSELQSIIKEVTTNAKK